MYITQVMGIIADKLARELSNREVSVGILMTIVLPIITKSNGNITEDYEVSVLRINLVRSSITSRTWNKLLKVIFVLPFLAWLFNGVQLLQRF